MVILQLRSVGSWMTSTSQLLLDKVIPQKLIAIELGLQSVCSNIHSYVIRMASHWGVWLFTKLTRKNRKRFLYGSMYSVSIINPLDQLGFRSWYNNKTPFALLWDTCFCSLITSQTSSWGKLRIWSSTKKRRVCLSLLTFSTING